MNPELFSFNQELKNELNERCDEIEKMYHFYSRYPDEQDEQLIINMKKDCLLQLHFIDFTLKCDIDKMKMCHEDINIYNLDIMEQCESSDMPENEYVKFCDKIKYEYQDRLDSIEHIEFLLSIGVTSL
mgnify:CR=1 FL=1